MKPDKPIHLPVSFDANVLTRLPLLVLYFRYSFFQLSNLGASLDDFAVSTTAAVSMNSIGFSMVSSHSGLWTNQWLFNFSHGDSTVFPAVFLYGRSNTLLKSRSIKGDLKMVYVTIYWIVLNL